jgi:hypothetical protein
VLVGCLTVLGILLVGVGSAGAAQDTGALVRPDPSVLEMSEGQVVILDVVVENAKDVYGIDVRARYDPAIVEVVDADPDKEGVQIKSGAFPKPDFLVRNAADNRVGTLQYVTTQLNPTLPANGSGIVFSTQFRGKAPGETALTIDSVQMADRLGRALEVSATGGKIRVVQGKSSMSSPTATQPAPEPVSSSPLPTSMTSSAAPVETSGSSTATLTSIPRVTIQVVGSAPTMTPVPAPGSSGAGPANCLGGSLFPALGLLGLARWRYAQRSRHRD